MKRDLIPDLNPDLLARPGRLTLAGCPEGYDVLVLASLAARQGQILHVVRDDSRLAALAEALSFVDPELEVLEFPAWDSVPYDRSPPHVEIVAKRIETLARLADHPNPDGRRIVLATVAAIMQRVPPAQALAGLRLELAKGQRLDMAALQAFLTDNGYSRTDTVMEQGEYAFRGGIIDIFAPGSTEPLRIDLFGDDIEALRHFDPMSQRSTTVVDRLVLRPAGEINLNPDSIQRFRELYRELFGTIASDDPLYEAISAGVRYAGMEHWLPLFYERLDTLFDYLPEAPVTLDHQAEEAKESRLVMIHEYYDARLALKGKMTGEAPYNPVPPKMLHIEREEWSRILAARPVAALWPFAPADNATDIVDAGGLPGRDFAPLRAQPGINLYDGVAAHVKERIAAGDRVVIALWSRGSRERLAGMLGEHGLAGRLENAEDWQSLAEMPRDKAAMVVLGLERGFVSPGLTLIAEQDILGERLVRTARRRKKAERFLAEASNLAEGDLVVHIDHGIGRYEGLEAISAGGAPHDCLKVAYDGNDRLYVPVENIEVLSRYGSEHTGVALDRLGGSAWQARKAKLKKRIRDMAEALIATAAQRLLKTADSLIPAEGLYDEFCARFPFVETEDQLRAIGDVIGDLSSGRPMDRLICGDVGFGKTEVALRAAFVAAMEGKQVAVVVPTTLLSRQHFATFQARFKGFPVRVGHLSRLVPAKQAAQTKADLAAGRIDIVVGTHAVLAKSIAFSSLGLLIIDEEQHFGVAHKERLKQLRAQIHVLTLTATPIPRTLQLALSGLRELSVMATPPVDRLAVRTFVLPFDGVVIREAILREKFRGGQCFYVCPRLADIERTRERLATLVPEIKILVAHGQLTPTELEDAMVAFAEGTHDVLLSTNIIESGLDMPRVNTIVIHRADMFGLSQLYQLRGRVGRSKSRGYAYLTLPPNQTLSKPAEARLRVMQTLDGLGAGFTLASHDLDIRGAGNLLGDEQSGHIREVGIELYQSLLEEAVESARGEGDAETREWSPQIAVGMPVLIPEEYVADLSVRLGLYRRIGALANKDEIDDLAMELTDRFGPLPDEVRNLLDVVAIKVLCKAAGIEKVDAGPKGAVLTFRNNSFPNPAGLVRFISAQLGIAKLRPDHKLVLGRPWDDPKVRLDGVRRAAESLAKVAAE